MSNLKDMHVLPAVEPVRIEEFDLVQVRKYDERVRERE